MFWYLHFGVLVWAITYGWYSKQYNNTDKWLTGCEAILALILVVSLFITKPKNVPGPNTN
jgi:hypothetical protein